MNKKIVAITKKKIRQNKIKTSLVCKCKKQQKCSDT